MLYIAFLRAINVGGRVVKMSELKAVFERLRLADVATFIASGNVAFRSADRSGQALEKRIARGLESALGYPVVTFVRTAGEVSAIAASRPFPQTAMEHATLFVGFLPAAPGRDALKTLGRLESETDRVRVQGRELYWLCRTAFRESSLSGALLEKTLGMPTTIRNMNTLRRLAAKYPSSGSE
jgi:uncharacterized protein (DUF1697 family)